MFTPRNYEARMKKLAAERNHKSYEQRCVELVERLAQMPDISEDMTSTWSPPDWDDVSDWWRDYVRTARNITGKSYRG